MPTRKNKRGPRQPAAKRKHLPTSARASPRAETEAHLQHCTTEEAFVIMQRTLRKLPETIVTRLMETAPPGAGPHEDLEPTVRSAIEMAMTQCALGLHCAPDPCSMLLSYCDLSEPAERVAREAFGNMQSEFDKLFLLLSLTVRGTPDQRQAMARQAETIISDELLTLRSVILLREIGADDIRAARKLNLRRLALKTANANETKRVAAFGLS